MILTTTASSAGSRPILQSPSLSVVEWRSGQSVPCSRIADSCGAAGGCSDTGLLTGAAIYRKTDSSMAKGSGESKLALAGVLTLAVALAGVLLVKEPSAQFAAGRDRVGCKPDHR